MSHEKKKSLDYDPEFEMSSDNIRITLIVEDIDRQHASKGIHEMYDAYDVTNVFEILLEAIANQFSKVSFETFECSHYDTK